MHKKVSASFSALSELNSPASLKKKTEFKSPMFRATQYRESFEALLASLKSPISVLETRN